MRARAHKAPLPVDGPDARVLELDRGRWGDELDELERGFALVVRREYGQGRVVALRRRVCAGTRELLARN